MAYRKEIEQVFKELDTSKNGLSSSDAASRLKADGYNELTEGKKTPLWKMFLESFSRSFSNNITYSGSSSTDFFR